MQTNNLIFPTDKLKIIEKNGVIYVYDIIRMRFVKCTQRNTLGRLYKLFSK